MERHRLSPGCNHQVEILPSDQASEPRWSGATLVAIGSCGLSVRCDIFDFLTAEVFIACGTNKHPSVGVTIQHDRLTECRTQRVGGTHHHKSICVQYPHVVWDNLGPIYQAAAARIPEHHPDVHASLGWRRSPTVVDARHRIVLGPSRTLDVERACRRVPGRDHRFTQGRNLFRRRSPGSLYGWIGRSRVRCD